MKQSKTVSILSSLLIALFFLSAAVATPILFRGWYYREAEALKLEEKTGYSTETIHGAFNQLMDYLVKDEPFGMGELPWSESGKSHFADCQTLFHLDFILLWGSAAGLILLAFLRRRVVPYRFLGRSPAFWTFVVTLAVFLVLGLWAVVDFSSLFSAFHNLFFPGKTNWIFDERTDPIILLLPEAFWAHTAALAGGLTLSGEALAVLGGAAWNWFLGPKNVYEMARDL